MRNSGLLTKYSNEQDPWETHCRSYAPDFVEMTKFKLPGGPILNAGCSTGSDNYVLGSLINRRVIGIDTNLEAIQEARRRFSSSEFHEGNIEDLDFPDNTFAAAYMVNVAHYLDDKEGSLDEIHRVLKEGGYFYVHFNTEIVDKDGNVDYQQDEKEIDALIEKSKFEVVSRRTFTREDEQPIRHEHSIIEYLLRKEPEKTKEQKRSKMLSNVAFLATISLLATSPVAVPNVMEYFFVKHALNNGSSIEEYKECHSCEDIEIDRNRRSCELGNFITKPARELAYKHHERRK